MLASGRSRARSCRAQARGYTRSSRESSPAEVDLVVHTHLHVDHVGWDGTFPNARYVVPTDDWSYFMSEESLQQRPHLGDRVEPLDDAGLVVLVDGELEVASGVRLVPTPGHTPGHASVFIESEGASWSCSATPSC